MPLPHFRNSENVKTTLYAFPYRAARSFTKNPIFRLFDSGGAVSSRSASNTVRVCLPKTYTVLRRPRASKLQHIELSSKFGGHSWKKLATTPALTFQAKPKLFVRIKLSYKLLNTSLLWRNVVFKPHDRMPV